LDSLPAILYVRDYRRRVLVSSPLVQGVKEAETTLLHKAVCFIF